MARFVALLGGINFGVHRVTMDRLGYHAHPAGQADRANTTRNIASLERLATLVR